MSLKVLLAAAAAQLAAAVVSNLPDTDVVDPEIVNDATKAENTYGFRLTHIFYGGLAKALDPANPNRWESPAWLEEADQAIATGGPVGTLAQSVLPLAQAVLPALTSAGAPALSALIQGLFAAKAAAATPASVKPATTDPNLGVVK